MLFGEAFHSFSRTNKLIVARQCQNQRLSFVYKWWKWNKQTHRNVNPDVCTKEPQQSWIASIESIHFPDLPVGSRRSNDFCHPFFLLFLGRIQTHFFHRKYIISTSAYSLPPMNEQQNKKNNNKKLMKLNSIIECKIWMREKFIHFEHENNNRKFQRPRRRSEKKYSKIQFLFRFALKCERKEREKAIAHRENKAKSFDRWVFEKF